MTVQLNVVGQSHAPRVQRSTVVVGYDGSDEARAALALARRRMTAADTVIVVHAMAPVASWLGAPYSGRIHEARRRRAQHVLAGLDVGDRQDEPAMELELLEGSAAEVIARVAQARDAREIVIGCRTHRRPRLARTSVAYQLLRTADRPVVVVPDKADPRRTP